MTIIPGRVSLLETIFQLDPQMNNGTPVHHLTLNDIDENGRNITNAPEQRFQKDSSKSGSDKFKDRKLGWFCIGTGGVGSGTENPYNVGNYESKLYNMVPIRLFKITSSGTQSDLTSAEQEDYALRREWVLPGSNTEKYIAYFAKKIVIENNGNLKITKSTTDDGATLHDIRDGWVQHNRADINNHPLKGTPILTSVKFSFEVGAKDFKDYFKAVNNGRLQGAALSEFGFIIGREFNATVEGKTYKEIDAPELFAKITMSKRNLDSEAAKLTVKYTAIS